MQELRKCQGQLYDETNAMSINSVEFGYTDAACAPTINQPAKFIIGIDCCKLVSGSSFNLLNGVNSQNSPINVLINLLQEIAAVRNLNLVIKYDALLEFHPDTRMLFAKV